MSSENELQDRVVIFDLTRHLPGNTRRDRSATVADTKANQSEFSVQKRIFRSDRYLAIWTIQRKIRQWLQARTVRGFELDGYFPIGIELVPEVIEHLKEAAAEVEAAREEFLSEYESVVAEAKERLKDKFDASQYPSVKRLRAGIGLEWSLKEFGTPSKEKVGEAYFEAEQAKAKDFWDRACYDAVALLRSELLDQAKHLAEVLAPRADGSKPKLYGETLEKAKEAFGLFSARNVMNDAEAQRLADRCRFLLEGRDVEMIKDSDRFRSKLAEEFGKVKAGVEQLLKDAPVRSISFDDE